MRIDKKFKESGPIHRIKNGNKADSNIRVNIYFSRISALGELLIKFIVELIMKSAKKKSKGDKR